MTSEISDELVSVLVPRRLYARVIQMLATELAAEVSGTAPKPSPHGERRWTPEEIRNLRRVVHNKTVRALMELTCDSPGKRITFQQVYERTGRTYGQARADLAGFSRLIRKTFDKTNWPLEVVQTPDKGQMYYAEPTIAAAWNDTSA